MNPGANMSGPGVPPYQGNPFDNPKMNKPERIMTGRLIVNGQPVQLDSHIQPVYIVALPIRQIAAGVMQGVVFGGLVLGFIGFLLSFVFMAVG